MVDAVEAVAGVGMLAWYLSALYVGGRLLRVGRQRDNAPARWIGAYLVLAMGMGSILLSVPMARDVVGGVPITLLDRIMVGLGCTTTALGNAAILTFTCRVFRRESSVARAAAIGIGVLLVLGAAGHGLVAGFDRDLTGVFAVIYLSGTVLTNAWASAESLRYYTLMRKRLKLGLVEPLEANRFLLWGCGAGAAAAMLLWTTFELQLQLVLDAAAIETLRRTTLPLIAGLGLACAGSYLLAFVPAEWYVRRFSASPQTASTQTG